MSEGLAGPGTRQRLKDPGARGECLAVHGVWGGAWGGVPGRTEAQTHRPRGSPAGE